ncbi:MAG: hypothetical protein GTO18_19225 [Anaerolineales bacterium]|nr:hypothetical protein [Anaerolineales bacterium]
MEIDLSIEIDRTASEVFSFIKDMENHAQEEGTNVLRVEKITDGQVGIGTQYREVVRMFPFLQVDMFNEVTRYEPNEVIEFTWRGGGMRGVFAYYVESKNGGSNLRLHEKITAEGIMVLFKPMIHRTFQETMERRLVGIKQNLEGSNAG